MGPASRPVQRDMEESLQSAQELGIPFAALAQTTLSRLELGEGRAPENLRQGAPPSPPWSRTPAAAASNASHCWRPTARDRRKRRDYGQPLPVDCGTQAGIAGGRSEPSPALP